LKAYPSRKLSRGFSVLTLSTLLGASCARAEESVVSETNTSLVFEPITVTGEKLERELKNTASSVTVISGREIDQQKTGDSTVHEVIPRSPFCSSFLMI